MNPTPGASVKILAPFNEAFPSVYTVLSSEEIEGGTVVFLEGVESGFDPKYLEVQP